MSWIEEAIGAKSWGSWGLKISNLPEVRGLWRPLLPSACILYIVYLLDSFTSFLLEEEKGAVTLTYLIRCF